MANRTAEVGFHYGRDAEQPFGALDRETTGPPSTFMFENFFHPYVGELIEKLNKESLAGLLDPRYHQGLARQFFTDYYDAAPNSGVTLDYFPKEIDVRPGGPYANYNWELLFHVPLAIAVHLSKSQRFAEAQRWFHFVFDPTSNDATIPPPQRFWKFLRFRQDTDVQQIDDLLRLLSTPDGELTVPERELKAAVQLGYERVRRTPFQPHAVAENRTVAYQYSVVMKYLDNLIAWGDSLFMQDTAESINEATQRYVMAANILGPRPQGLPQPGTVRPKTFAQLKAGLDDLGNALVELEGQFPFNLVPPPSQNGAGGNQSGPLFGIGRTLYFCIPRNERLLGYWDTVADRLLKIRNCMNIEGVVRQLALFDPPIDPGMLVKAAAAGIDLGSVVSGLNQPIGPVRSLPMIQKALELCGEVRNLGGALLSALEKGDGERLVLLRQGHEIKIQEMSREVRFLQWKQAQEATESLLKSRASVLERYRYYQRLLGLTPDGKAAPDTLPLDRRELTEENFDEAYGALVARYEKEIPAQAYPQLRLAGGTSPANQSGASGQGQLYLNTNEDVELAVHSPKAQENRDWASRLDITASTLSSIPGFSIRMHFWGLGAATEIPLGTMLSNAARAVSSHFANEAQDEDRAGQNASKTGSYERRADDWLLQHNLAARELMQLGRQVISSLIAEQVAHHEYLNLQTQISQAQEVNGFLQQKFTNEELYGWMQGEISRLYYEYYRFAFDTARKAERTMKQELMRSELDGTDYVKFNYWDGGRKGLLSGEALYLDVKRMEMAYHETNRREFEMTRHVSLRQLDPLALLSLRATGKCEVVIPEWLYDRDCPGHYLRRLKSVAVSLPSVVGPYTSVNCTLSLLRSSVRRSSLLKDGAYGRTGADDDRFVDYFGSVQSVVTSGASNDGGLFETNLRDERFLPFEGAGAVSAWRLQLPEDFRPFDYATISDVIMHVRYTARQGGDLLGTKAIEELRETLSTQDRSGLTLLFSLRHDFPSEWSGFVNGDADFAMPLRKDQFPYMVQDKTLAIDALALYVNKDRETKHRAIAVPDDLVQDLNGAGRAHELSIPPDDDAVPDEDKVLTRASDAQVFLVVSYGLDGGGE